MGKRLETPDTAPPAIAGPASFLAAAVALAAIDDAVHAARTTQTADTGTDSAGPEPALAALVLLRELRTELAGWEAGLVETARAEGATWADLAHPMGVASRQAAENRYLRLRPSGGARHPAEETGAERVKAVRDRRAADRAVTAWARDHAADLRILAARITASGDVAAAGTPTLTALTAALGTADPADLIAPLADIRPHLGTAHPDLTARLDDLTHQTERLRHDSDQQRA
ncbi:type III effector protein [Kitasatospora sp. NPDC048365]|uniref:type III effector protein n=1 Tax=Kitasatospora sp. NPDC048365 TaxID=3364050 RepID=UPI0037181FDE